MNLNKPIVANKLSKNVVIGIVVFMLLMATAAYYNLPNPQKQNAKFGWEYGNIAESLVTGYGFANAFDDQGGPTAWMPPVYVFFMTGLFYLFGIKSAAALWVMFIFKYAGITLSLIMLLIVVDKAGYARYRYLLIPLFLGPLYLNRTTFFLELHDVWLNMFLSCLMLYTFAGQIYDKSRISHILLFTLAFVLPVTSPSLALAFITFETGYFLTQTYHLTRNKFSERMPIYQFDDFRKLWRQKDLRRFILIAVIFAFSTLLWTYRNYQVFGLFIPIKSNLWFDFYQTNVIDPDGIVSYETFRNYHPVHVDSLRTRYNAHGEADFLAEYKPLSFLAVQRNPYKILQNITHRASNAFLFVSNPNDTLPLDIKSADPTDLAKLFQIKLIYVNDGQPVPLWTSLTMPQEEFMAHIQSLNLTHETTFIQDWVERRRDLERRDTRWLNVIKSISISLIPFCCLVLGMILSEVRANKVFVVAATIYLVYLTPYILVSHYLRYQTPLIGLQTIFIFFCIAFVFDYTSQQLEHAQFWGLKVGDWSLEVKYYRK